MANTCTVRPEDKVITYEKGMQGVERLYYNYTRAALEDEFLYLLSSKTECDITLENNKWFIHPFHPYINQAEGWLYKMNINDPIPEFVIWRKDIPVGLAKALQGLGEVTMKRVITDAVRRLYESVDPIYYHKNGIYGKVRWGFDKPNK